MLDFLFFMIDLFIFGDKDIRVLCIGNSIDFCREDQEQVMIFGVMIDYVQ